MRNLTNNINKIHRKAENEHRRVEVRKYRAIGRAMLAQQDHIDKLNSLLHKLGVQMDNAMSDPAAVDAMYALLMARRDRAARAAEKRKKAAVEREAQRAAAKKKSRTAVKSAAAAAADSKVTDADIHRMVREMFGVDTE